MDKANMKAVLQKYTMIIVLILVTLFFTWKTGGKIRAGHGYAALHPDRR